MVPILFNCDSHMCIYIVDNDLKLILKVSVNCGVEVLWIRKFSRDFYFAIFSFSNYSRVLKFASKHLCSRPFPWVEDRRSLYFMRETN